MPVPSLISELSTTAGSNSPAGSESPVDGDNYLRAHAGFIAQLNADKLDKSGSVVPTANQPMGTYKFTNAGSATQAGEFLVWGQAATVSTLTTTGAASIGGTSVTARQQVVGVTTATITGINVDTVSTSGKLAFLNGNDTTGAAWTALYLLTTRPSGGSGTQFTATLISRSGSTSPTLSFAVSGTNVQLTTGANASFSYISLVG